MYLKVVRFLSTSHIFYVNFDCHVGWRIDEALLFKFVSDRVIRYSVAEKENFRV
jgi:hypothetical protein